MGSKNEISEGSSKLKKKKAILLSLIIERRPLPMNGKTVERKGADSTGRTFCDVRRLPILKRNLMTVLREGDQREGVRVPDVLKNFLC